MTKNFKEAVKATIAIIFVLLAIFAFLIYPLNQAGKIIARPPSDQSKPDSTGQLAGAADTATFVTEDNLKLAAHSILSENARGTVILLHGLKTGMVSQMAKAAAMHQAGFNVIIYDQRAFGASEGIYRSGGFFEANDLQAVISRLDLQNRLIHPVLAWGEEHGATAAIRMWSQEDRLDYLVVENPVVNGRDWQKRVIQYNALSAPDFSLGLIWWWMKQKSGYEISSEEIDITEPLSAAFEKNPDRVLALACGEGENIPNRYLQELADLGGNWLILPCGEDGPFASSPEKVVTEVLGLVRPGSARKATP